MEPFKPVGDRARWKVIYDLLVRTSTGEVLTYETIGEAVGLDASKDRQRIQMAIRRAAREHLTKDKRALDVVPNVGYRVVDAPEHLLLARRYQGKANRALARGHSAVTNVDLTGVGPEVRQAFEVVGAAFAMQMDFNRRFDVRQRRIEKAVSEIANTSSEVKRRTEEEIAELRARLERLESGD